MLQITQKCNLHCAHCLHVQELAVRSEGLEAYFTALVGGDSHADAG